MKYLAKLVISTLLIVSVFLSPTVSSYASDLSANDYIIYDGYLKRQKSTRQPFPDGACLPTSEHCILLYTLVKELLKIKNIET